MANDNAKPRTVWIQRNGYAIELTEDEVRSAYAQCECAEHPERASASALSGYAVSEMTNDLMRLVSDLKYAAKRYAPEPDGVFGNQ